MPGLLKLKSLKLGKCKRGSMKIAIGTVATLDYLDGAESLFYSLSIHNDLSNFDLWCFTDAASNQMPKSLNHVKTQRFDGDWTSTVTNEIAPRFSATLRKLESFQFLADSGYDALFLIDSDILCLGHVPFRELASRVQILGASRDYACTLYYSTELAVFGLDVDTVINTGFLVIKRDFQEAFSARELIKEVKQRGVSYDGGDQGFLNWFIQQRQIPLTFLDMTFNRPLDINYPIHSKPPSMLHFTGPKPWEKGASKKVNMFFRPLYKLAIRHTGDARPFFDTKNDKAKSKTYSRLIFELKLRFAWSAFIGGSLLIRLFTRKQNPNP